MDAPLHVAMRVDELLDGGNLDGYAVWKRILKVVKELLRDALKVGERRH